MSSPPTTPKRRPQSLNPFLSPPDAPSPADSPGSSATYTPASDITETETEAESGEPRVRTAIIERVSTELGRVLELDTMTPVRLAPAPPLLPLPPPPHPIISPPRKAVVKDRRPQPLQPADDAIEQLDLHRLSAFHMSPRTASSVSHGSASPSDGYDAGSTRAPAPPVHTSFMRWSQLTGSVDNASVVSPPSSWSFHGDADVAKRSSHGTFGRPARRWSAAPSSASGRDGENPFADACDGRRPASDDEAESPRRPGRKPRPVSLSSASTGSGAPDPPLVALAHTSSAGHFPSPTMRKPTHNSPETDSAIDTHLLRSSSLDAARIVPRARALPPGLAPKTAPPSSGTPLRAGGVKEEATDSSGSDFGGPRVVPNTAHARKNSKLDQVLGDGAETARVLLEFERRVVDKALQSPVSPLPPPARGHKSSTSQPLRMVTPPPAEPISLPLQRARSSSLDSLPSLHPSLTESTHTLARLLPPAPPPAAMLPPIPHISPIRLPRMPPAISSKNELTADQKARLVRRTRKLEQVLGETLHEATVERFVIEPSTMTQTVLTRVESDDAAWPATPAAAAPEWVKADCVPRRSKEDDAAKLDRSASKIARKAKAALGVARHASKTDDDIKVYVAREMRVSETTVAMKPAALAASPMSPAESVEQEWGVDEAEDEGSRRTRRMQLTKLHRLLGVPIPAALVGPSSQEDLRDRSVHSSMSGSYMAPLSGAGPTYRPGTPDSSFMSFDDTRGATHPTKWASKIRQSMKVRSIRGPLTPTPTGLGIGGMNLPAPKDSFMELGDEKTDKERQAARRRAHKLEQIFGDVPPAQSVYVPTHSPAPSYDAYRDSLKGLIYMVEHDRDRLTSIVDELVDPADATFGHAHMLSFASRTSQERYGATPSPPSPRLQSPLSLTGDGIGAYHDPADVDMASSDPDAASADTMAELDLDPSSPAARRRRTGKLSHFFGEAGVDFTADAPPPPPASGARRKSRRETLDAVLGEMWRGVQTDVRGGSLRGDEAASLGDLIRTLRSKREEAGMWEEL
ncbi:hypothetical protein Q5752_003076 [Cryptotrichosporon argae]